MTVEDPRLAQIRALCDEVVLDVGERAVTVGEVVARIRAVVGAPPVDVTPPQGIDRDALLDWIKGRDWREWNYPTEVVDGILALVRPVPPQGLDRGALIGLLGVHRWKDMGVDWCSCECGVTLRGDASLTEFPADSAFREHVADRILALVGPVPPQDIDRDVLWQHVFDAVIDWDAQVDDIRRDEFVDQLVALVRPVEGIVLTPEEAALAAQWARDVRALSGTSGLAAERALAARLGAAS